MKSVPFSKRFRVSLALLTALAMPLGSALHLAEAKPKSSAPAYGYRAKSASKAHKREYKHNRRQVRRDRREDRRDYRRNDRNTARPNYRNERYDDRRSSDRRSSDTNRLGVNSDRLRDALSILKNR